MQVITADRRLGKTTAALAWLVAGRPIPTYPGWSRVLVCPNTSEALRLPSMLPPGPWRKCIITARELRGFMRGVARGSIEIAVDNVDMLLADMLGTQQRPALITMTGQHRTPEEITP